MQTEITAAKRAYEPKRIRSATAPDTMVVAVPQNRIWNTRNAIAQLCSGELPTPASASLPSPNMMIEPIAQKLSPEMQRSVTFLAATLMVFFDWTSPASRAQNPICIRKTRADAMSIHKPSKMSCSIRNTYYQ